MWDLLSRHSYTLFEDVVLLSRRRLFLHFSPSKPTHVLFPLVHLSPTVTFVSQPSF